MLVVGGGVRGTGSLPKVGLVLTSDVRHQQNPPDHLVWRPRADNREIMVEVVEEVVMLYGTKINVSHLSEWSGAVRDRTVQHSILLSTGQ